MNSTNMITLRNTNNNPKVTMSSREIAELTGKRHDSVKRTIDTLAASKVIRLPQIVDSEIINNLGFGQPIREYRFYGPQGKRDSIIVVAQLCPEFTARLVDRWQELEEQVGQQPVFAIPKTLPEALRLAADLADQVQALDKKVEHLAPQAAALALISADEKTYTPTAAAKILDMSPRVGLTPCLLGIFNCCALEREVRATGQAYPKPGVPKTG